MKSREEKEFRKYQKAAGAVDELPNQIRTYLEETVRVASEYCGRDLRHESEYNSLIATVGREIESFNSELIRIMTAACGQKVPDYTSRLLRGIPEGNKD